MLTLTFDTLDFANRLKAGNVPDEQAQAQAHALHRVLEERDRALAALEHTFKTQQALARQEAERAATKGDLMKVRAELKEDIAATRGDLAEVRNELKGNIAEVRSELKGDIANLRNELKEDIAGLRNEVKEDIAGLRNEVKEDVAGLRSEVKEDVADLRTEVRTELAQVRGEMKLLRWMMGTVLAASLSIIVGVLSLVIKAFF